MSAETFVWWMFTIFLVEAGGAIAMLTSAKLPCVLARTSRYYVIHLVLSLAVAASAWWALHP